MKPIVGSKDERQERVYAAWRAFADAILNEAGECRARSLALTNAEQAFMWAREAVVGTEQSARR